MKLSERWEIASRRWRITPDREEAIYKNSLAQYSYNALNIQERDIFLPAFEQVVVPVLGRYLDPHPNNVLEVGCGTGFFSRKLAPDWLKPRLVSYDVNTLSLADMQREDPDSRLFQASSFGIPIQTGKIDAVIGYSSFDTYVNLGQVIEEVSRVLKPGGRIILFQDVVTQVYLFRFESMAQFWDQTVERYHEVLISELRRKGFSILAGRDDFLEGFAVEPIDQVRERVDDFELEVSPFPIAVVWDRGRHKYLRRNTREFAKITKEDRDAQVNDESEELVQLPLLQNIAGGAGDLIEVVKMRYLVAEKPTA